MHDREVLVNQAKEAWKRKQDAGKGDSSTFWSLSQSKLSMDVLAFDLPFDLLLLVVTDPEDPRFDLEKLLAKYEKDS